MDRVGEFHIIYSIANIKFEIWEIITTNFKKIKYLWKYF